MSKAPKWVDGFLLPCWICGVITRWHKDGIAQHMDCDVSVVNSDIMVQERGERTIYHSILSHEKIMETIHEQRMAPSV